MKEGYAWKFIGTMVHYWTGSGWTRYREYAQFMTYNQYKTQFNKFQRIYIKFEEFIFLP